uniref:hypothetical protein n=1 Tax=Candidatus Saccharicenans sp. TaxID=2819258 RepID=UPI00404A0117
MAFTLIMLLSTGRYFWKYQTGIMLSLALVLTFFLLVGVRDAVSIPVNYEANWVFRITENRDRWPYFLALRKSIFLLYILPLYAVLFVLYGTIWSWKAAMLHCLYDLAFAVLLMEVLFFQYKKFPFACSYLPGKSQLHILDCLYNFIFCLHPSSALAGARDSVQQQAFYYLLRHLYFDYGCPQALP